MYILFCTGLQATQQVELRASAVTMMHKMWQSHQCVHVFGLRQVFLSYLYHMQVDVSNDTAYDSIDSQMRQAPMFCRACSSF